MILRRSRRGPSNGSDERRVTGGSKEGFVKVTELVGQSWRLIWQRKSLLRLGLVSTAASLLAWAALPEAYRWAWVESPALMERLTGIPRNPYMNMWGIGDYPTGIGPFTCGILVICLVLWLVGLAARGGLITAVDDIEGQDAPGSAFSGALRRGPRLARAAFSLRVSVHPTLPVEWPRLCETPHKIPRI